MRYAKALMQYAKDTGKEDELYQDMRMLSRSLEKYPDLRSALENPLLSMREKFSLICTAAVGKGTAGREFSRFITLLLKMRRENLLQYISLSFLGLGMSPPTPTWGNMLQDGKNVLECAPWLSLYPGLAILITVLGYNLLGESLRDWLDPRLKQ